MSRTSPDARRTDDGHGSLFSEDGLRRRAVREAAAQPLERWGHGTSLSTIRRRLRLLCGASLAVISFYLLLNPGGGLAGSLFGPDFSNLTGVTETLRGLWFLLSLLTAPVTAGLLVLLRDPTGARDVWWEDGTLATVGLVSLAALAKASRSGPEGRAVWELLFGERLPAASGSGSTTDQEDVDPQAVARIRRLVGYALAGSGATIVLETAVGYGLFELAAGDLGGASLDPIEATMLAAGATVLGVVVGLIGGATDL